MVGVCKFWQQGNCRNGDSCRFLHPGAEGGGQTSAPRGGGRGRGRGGYNNYDDRPPPRTYETDHYEPRNNSYGPQGDYGGGRGQGGYRGRGGYQDTSRQDVNGYNSRGGYGNQRGGYQNDRGGRGGGQHSRAPPPTPASQLNEYNFSKDTLLKDLTPGEDLPIWVMSSFCPGVKAPMQLFGGEEREKSFEEMRLNHYMLREQGQEALAAHQQDELINKVLQQNENAKQNLEAAYNYIMKGKDEHPNRIDIVEMYNKCEIDVSQPLPDTLQAIIRGALPSTVIPKPSPPQVDAFGRPIEQQDAPTNPFGGQANAFAQPQHFHATNSLAPTPFGQPAQPQSSPFGAPQQQPSPLQQQNAFGQPPPNAINSLAPTALGQSAQQQQSPFQQQNVFGQPQQQPNPLANSMPTPPQSSPFMQQGSSGQPEQQQQQTAIPFGQSQQALAMLHSSGMGPSALGQPAQAQGAFGQPQQQQQASPFGQPQSQPPTNGTAPSPWGQPQQPNPLGGQNPLFPLSQTPQQAHAQQQTLVSQAPQPFNGELPQGTFISIFTKQPFPGPWADPSPYRPGSKVQHPHVSTYSTRDPNTNRLTSWKGHPVIYKGTEPYVRHPLSATEPGVREEKVWFPNGPPPYNVDNELGPDGKLIEYSIEDENAYAIAEATGRFPGDKCPRNPPRLDWVRWDL